MSAIRLTQPSRNVILSRPQLRLVSQPQSRRRSKPKLAVVSVLLFGAIGISLANLFLNIMTSSAVYELADLQAQKRELTTTAQILGQEVDSLSSQQNLSNSAQRLGMIANANPVFLNITDQQVFGKPKAALNTDGRVTKNLIANSAMTQSSTNLKSAVASVSPAKNVANQKPAAAQVTSNGGAIPASPTN